MLHVDATFEDNRLIITRDCGTGSRAIGTNTGVVILPNGPPATNKWNGIIIALSGKSVAVSWDDDQVSAILALANGLGESLFTTNKKLVDDLYAIAEPCFHNWISLDHAVNPNPEKVDTFPPECRLIP